MNEAANQFGFEIGSLLETSDKKVVPLKFEKMNILLKNHVFLSDLNTPLFKTKQSRENLFTSETRWKTYIPAISWYGGKNQYHLWLLGNGKDRKGLLRGDFGISYIDGQPIQSKIWQKVGISFSLSIISIFLAYLISIPIGIYSYFLRLENS